jgi:AraC-like DNA-binding protein/mannose-6-phosphate isomerase-like protein (cupin superfamily)
MIYVRPNGVLAGFHADEPDSAVPEIVHIGEQWVPATFRIHWHEHAVWEFYLQLDGASVWQSGRETYRLTAGHFFAAPPGVRHALKDTPAKHHFFFCGIDLAVVLRRHPTLRRAWLSGRCIHLPHADSLNAPFRQLIREVSMHLPHRAEGMRTALDQVVIEATRLMSSVEQKAVLPLHHSVEKAKDILDHHCEEPWRLRELGRVVAMSPNHLVTLFGREVGLSPRQYQLQRRIARAKESLRDSDVSITDLALTLGFSSSQHFAKMFKQFTGLSAQAYRAKIQKRR